MSGQQLHLRRAPTVLLWVLLLLLLLLHAEPHIISPSTAAAAAAAEAEELSLPQPGTPSTASRAGVLWLLPSPPRARQRQLLQQQQQKQQKQQKPTTLCKLILRGSTSSTPNTAAAQASLTCSGPPITAAAHKAIAAKLKQTAGKGVIWDPQGCENLGCLFSICGSSSVTFQAPQVVNIRDQTLAAAICVTGGANVEFVGGKFTRALTSQGALLVVGAAKVTLRGTEVTHNTANSTFALVNMGGGLVVQEGAQVRITDSLITGNRVLGELAALGAAIVAQDRTRIFMFNSTIEGNVAVAPGLVGYASGGGLYAEGSAVVEAYGVRFSGNVANGTSLSAAGAVNVMHNVTLTLMNCTFTKNVAKSAATGVAGVLAALNSSRVRIVDCTFSSNAALGVSGLGAGGVLFAANQAVVRVDGGVFLDNVVNGSFASTAAAIASFDNATLHVRGSVVAGGSLAAANSVTGGGIACFNSSSLLLEDSVVTRNHANSSTAPAAGGGLGCHDDTVVHVKRCNFSQNWVNGSGQAAGGGVFAQGSSTTLVVEDSLFDSNSAVAYEETGGFAGGGGVGAVGPIRVVLRRCAFHNNHVVGISGTDGGGVYGGGSVHVSIEACQFTGNSAAGIIGVTMPSLISCGGAVGIADKRSFMLVNSSRFAANVVGGIQTCGGAACAINGGEMHLYASLFEANLAAGAMTCGGGVCANNNASLHIEGVTFKDNDASGVSQGGAACTAAASNATFLRSSFRHNHVGWAGGAIGIGDSCYTTVSHCAFLNNTATNAEAGCGGAISVGFEALKKDFASCVIDSSSFVGNIALGRRGSGGAVYTANAALSISNSRFVANVAQQGGGLGGSGVSWDVRDTVFLNHTVIGPGGALFTSGHLNVTITRSNISHNRGSEGGAMYAASSIGQSFQLSLHDTTISNNEAQTGGGLFLRAGDTHIGPGTIITRNVASQQAGGVGWVGSCGVGQVCTSVLDISCGAKISGNDAAVAGGGLFVGQAFNTHLKPPTDCAAEAVHNNSAAFGDANVFFVKSVCKPGEVSKGGWCDMCPTNMFSLASRASKCEICPENAVCPGGDVLLPESGFWHSTNNSTQMHICPNPIACDHTLHPINARAPIDWQCSTGYAGRVCGSCKTPGYGFTNPFKCGRCMSFERTVALYVTAYACLLAFLTYSAQATWRDNLQRRVTPRVSDTIKTLVLYVNYVLIISSVRVEWPKSLGILYTATAWLLSSASGQVLSLDCILPVNGALPRAVARQLVYLLVPVLVICCVLFVFVVFWAVPAAVARCCRLRHRHRVFTAHVTAKVPTAVLVSLYLFFPSLVRVSWGMFACLKLDQTDKLPFPEYATATAPYGYWVQDMQQACYEGWHLGWSLGLGFSCTLLFCGGVPAVLFWWLAKNKQRLTDPGFQTHFGFLYADFKQDRYWWEAVVAARTVVLVCVAVFASVVGAYYGVVMFVVVFHVSLVLQLSFRPFAFAQLHRIQLAALSCLDLTACITLTFFSGNIDRSSPALSTYKEVAGAFLLAMHAGVILWCIWVIACGTPLGRLRNCACAVAARQRLHNQADKLRGCCLPLASCRGASCAKASHSLLPDNSSHNVPPQHQFSPRQLSPAGKASASGSGGSSLSAGQPGVQDDVDIAPDNAVGGCSSPCSSSADAKAWDSLKVEAIPGRGAGRSMQETSHCPDQSQGRSHKQSGSDM